MSESLRNGEVVQVDEHGYSDRYDHTLTEKIAVLLASLTFNINGDTSKLDWDDFYGPLFRERAVLLIRGLEKDYTLLPISDYTDLLDRSEKLEADNEAARGLLKKIRDSIPTCESCDLPQHDDEDRCDTCINVHLDAIDAFLKGCGVKGTG